MGPSDREWRDATTVTVRLPMQAAVTTGYNGAVAVERGPLVYALRVEADWRRINADKPQRELPHGDFEVYPRTPWNYGLIVDPARAADGIRIFRNAVEYARREL